MKCVTIQNWQNCLKKLCEKKKCAYGETHKAMPDLYNDLYLHLVVVMTQFFLAKSKCTFFNIFLLMKDHTCIIICNIRKCKYTVAQLCKGDAIVSWIHPVWPRFSSKVHAYIINITNFHELLAWYLASTEGMSAHIW